MIKKSSGFSLIEVLIAMVILAITLVPAMDAIRTGMKGAEVHQDFQEQHYHLMSKMEEVLAESFSDLDIAATLAASPDNPSSYSDSANNLNVFIARYDVDNADADDDVFTGTDEMIWVRTQLIDSGLVFESLVAP